MPGNKKPRKKGRAVQSAQELFAGLERNKQDRIRRYQKLNARVHLKNNLPIGHELNKHRLDTTFGPIEKLLDEQARGESMLCDGDGRPVIYDPDDQDFILLVPGLLHMCHLYDKMGEMRTWPKQPQGLRAFVLKLSRNELVNLKDIEDARVSIAWMRKQVATVTPAQWTEMYEWVCAMDEKEDQQRQAA